MRFARANVKRSFSEVYSYFTPYLRYTNELHPQNGLNGRADKVRSRIGRSRSRYLAPLPRSSLVRPVSRAIVLRLHPLEVVCPRPFCLEGNASDPGGSRCAWEPGAICVCKLIALLE
jgi:hypothetical protein